MNLTSSRTLKTKCGFNQCYVRGLITVGSKINYEKYGISKARYEELRAFCMQYSEYKTRRRQLRSGVVSVSSESAETEVKILGEKISLIEHCVKQACTRAPGVYKYLLRNVTEPDCGYNLLLPPIEKNSFYKLRKDFFILLNKSKK